MGLVSQWFFGSAALFGCQKASGSMMNGWTYILKSSTALLLYHDRLGTIWELSHNLWSKTGFWPTNHQWLQTFGGKRSCDADQSFTQNHETTIQLGHPRVSWFWQTWTWLCWIHLFCGRWDLQRLSQQSAAAAPLKQININNQIRRVPLGAGYA